MSILAHVHCKYAVQSQEGVWAYYATMKEALNKALRLPGSKVLENDQRHGWVPVIETFEKEACDED